jgi:hypothetical protein
MTFPRMRAPGTWVYNDVVDPAEFEAIDRNISQAIDGTGGGVYVVQNDLVIGAAPGIQVVFAAHVEHTATVVFNNDLFALGHAEFNSDLVARGFSQFSSDVYVGGDLRVDGFGQFTFDLLTSGSVGVNGNLDVDGHAHLFGDVSLGNAPSDNIGIVGSAIFVSGATFLNTVEILGAFNAQDGEFSGFLAVDGELEVLGDATFGGNVTLGTTAADNVAVQATVDFNADVGFGAPVVFAAEGNVAWRNQTITDAGDQVIDAAHVNVVRIPNGMVATDVDYTISDAGCRNGYRVRFATDEATHTITVRRPSGAQLARIGGPVSTYTDFGWVDVERVGGVWWVTAAGVMP